MGKRLSNSSCSGGRRPTRGGGLTYFSPGLAVRTDTDAPLLGIINLVVDTPGRLLEHYKLAQLYAIAYHLPRAIEAAQWTVPLEEIEVIGSLTIRRPTASRAQ